MDPELSENNTDEKLESIVDVVHAIQASNIMEFSSNDIDDPPMFQPEVKMSGSQESDIEGREGSNFHCSSESAVDLLKTMSPPPPPPDKGDELNYKKTVGSCSDNSDSDEDYHNITKICGATIESNPENDSSSTVVEKEGMFNHSGENDISAVLCCEQLVREIVMCAVQSGSGPTSDTEAANHCQFNCRENDSSGEHLINTADVLSPPVDSADLSIEPNMTQNCPNAKTTGLLDWLQAKETEVNAILEEVNVCHSQHNESEQELQNLLEELADIDGLKSEFQVKNLQELTESILKAPEAPADPAPDLFLPTPLKSKPEKNRKSKPTVKSPLLRRKEIKTCLNLHRACEDSEVLQELLIPAVRFGNSENYLEDSEVTTSDEAQFITKSVDDIDHDTTNVISRNSVRPDLLTIAIFHP